MNKKPTHVWTMWSRDESVSTNEAELDWLFGVGKPSREEVENALGKVFGGMRAEQWKTLGAKLWATNKLELRRGSVYYGDYNVWLVKLKIGKEVDIEGELV